MTRMACLLSGPFAIQHWAVGKKCECATPVFLIQTMGHLRSMSPTCLLGMQVSHQLRRGPTSHQVCHPTHVPTAHRLACTMLNDILAMDKHITQTTLLPTTGGSATTAALYPASAGCHLCLQATHIYPHSGRQQTAHLYLASPHPATSHLIWAKAISP